MSDLQNLILTRNGSILHVTLNHPATRNALSRQMVIELRKVAEQSTQDAGLRCIVLRGARGNFCAGGNFADFQQMIQSPAPAEGEDPIATANREFGRMLQEWLKLPQVVIAVVEGAAMGGGLGLVAIADMVLTEGGAQFAMPETSIGLPPAQIAPFVALRIGQSQTRRLALTAARLVGWQALQAGLVSEVLEGATELEVALQKTLRSILRSAPRALASTKAILQHRDAVWIDETLDFAAQQFAKALRNGDAAEGVSAYTEKRTAVWVELPPEAT
jgi:isohexenylglutaconyl-CoA hydratase